MDEVAMTSLGRYQVLRPLAKVGADEVFLAQTAGVGGAEYHVVRPLGEGVFEDARRAAWLRHPNLVAVRELGQDYGRWFAATEYVHGEDLRRVLTRLRRHDDHVPIAVVTAIGVAAAAGLHHAHTHNGSRRTRRGSIHGRLTPSSILIGYDGTVKISDLGLASEADAAYLAPEQIGDGPVDQRADVFALGAVLYELATARRLFKAPTDVLTKAAISHAPVPPPSRFRRGLPRALEVILLKALAPSPADRFKSAGELHDALEAFTKKLGLGMSQAGIADYLRTLFGVRPFPWILSTRRSSARVTVEIVDEKEPYGVAAPPDWVLRELGIPEAAELEATPGKGVKTPMSWMSQAGPPEVSSRRQISVIAAAIFGGAAAGFLVVSMIAGPGDAGGDRLAPASAPPPPAETAPAPERLPPPPPPPPPPPAETAPAPVPVLQPTPDARPTDGSDGSAGSAADRKPAVRTKLNRTSSRPRTVAAAVRPSRVR
jgi:hypothetical protein